MRVAALSRDAGVDGEVARFVEACVGLTMTYPREQLIEAQAPVLFVPRVLPFEQCESLMEFYKGVNLFDPMTHVRKNIEVPPDIRVALEVHLFSRMPQQISKAFQFFFSYYGHLRLTCQGAAIRAPHRYNENTRSEHWRFAMSLSLNDDYEGGAVRFPEYGDALYRPARGTAMISSCALLHAATPVTKGHRIALEAFFWTEKDSLKAQTNQVFPGYRIGVPKKSFCRAIKKLRRLGGPSTLKTLPQRQVG